jgi:hypothetical protein
VDGVAVAVADDRPIGVDVGDLQYLGLEQERLAGFPARVHQVLDDLLLAVHLHAPPARQLGDGDAVALPHEAELQPFLGERLALEPLAHAHLDHQVDGPLLEQAGADALLDVLLGARLEHHRVDALETEQAAQQQAGGAGADDADLGSRRHVPPLRGHPIAESRPATIGRSGRP